MECAGSAQRRRRPRFGRENGMEVARKADAKDPKRRRRLALPPHSQKI